MQYDIILWGHAVKNGMLFNLQMKAIRYLAKASTNPYSEVFYKDSSVPLLTKLNELTLSVCIL